MLLTDKVIQGVIGQAWQAIQEQSVTLKYQAQDASWCQV